MRALLAVSGMVFGLLVGPLTFLHAQAESSRPQYCIAEGWHFDAGPVRDQVIAQCMGRR